MAGTIQRVNDQTDQQLLRDYAERQSEAAFAAIVHRYVDLVYSAALRLSYDAHTAKDVTQSVFVALAQNTQQLTDRPVLAGWLHTTARNLTVKTVRSDARRRVREQEAVVMNELLSTNTDAGWEQVAPLLDHALSELDDTDRDAVLLRYFKNHDLRTVGAMLGISDDAAQKRVSRAVERLREFFAKRGVTVGTGGLAVVISANAVQAAPVGLTVAISTAAVLTGKTLATAATVTATKAITMTAIQKSIVTATIAVLTGAGIYEARQASQLRAQVRTLQQQQAPLAEQIQQLQGERENSARQIAALREDYERLNKNSNELLRLRGEVGVLRRSNQELAQRMLQNNNISKTESNVRQTGEFTPKAEWKDVGIENPETAAQTYFWAITAGRGDKIGMMLALPDELASQAANFKMQDFSNIFTEKAKEAFSTYKALRIVKTEYPSPDEAKVTVQMQNENEEMEFMPLTFKRIGNQWNVRMDLFGPTANPTQPK